MCTGFAGFWRRPDVVRRATRAEMARRLRPLDGQFGAVRAASGRSGVFLVSARGRCGPLRLGSGRGAGVREAVEADLSIEGPFADAEEGGGPLPIARDVAQRVRHEDSLDLVEFLPRQRLHGIRAV